MIYKKIDLHSAVFANVSEEIAQEYIDFRISVKKPLTQGAFNRALNEAVKCESLGLTANEAILMTIDKGWHGVTPEYIAKELNNRCEAALNLSLQQSINKPTRQHTIVDDLTNRSWGQEYLTKPQH